jgi:hypothetical protein
LRRPFQFHSESFAAASCVLAARLRLSQSPGCLLKSIAGCSVSRERRGWARSFGSGPAGPAPAQRAWSRPPALHLRHMLAFAHGPARGGSRRSESTQAEPTRTVTAALPADLLYRMRPARGHLGSSGLGRSTFKLTFARREAWPPALVGRTPGRRLCDSDGLWHCGLELGKNRQGECAALLAN